MAEATGGKTAVSFEGLDKAIDAFSRLFDTVWAKSPALVWFCAIMISVIVLYHVHCRSLRAVETVADDQVRKKMPKKSKGRQALTGGKKNA
ncbi:hypothetical protein LD001_05820 [Pseudomonas kurunegalensis]|uniref:hypothetical protein n=1 Tax=Pseudomonas kurunegalensis TaxID=485880 RepID=UPI001CDD3498|nr:hypothetical protein [Pseudomonas kurunegalensis]MCA4074848.1 hypothetical protein [Pseudomonas kurunegalensis]